MRLFAVSDLHADYKENRDWMSRLSQFDYVNDAVILAGDISDSIDRVERCFEHFVSRFSKVFFVPGNHELWVSRFEEEDSLRKFSQLISLAKAFGVHTERQTIGAIDVVPLFSWYDFSFGEPGEELARAWVDFRRCRWPDALPDAQAVSKFFLAQNEGRLDPSPRPVVSFSHFLPRIDVMPKLIPAKHQIVYPVLGSAALDVQIRKLGSVLHIYGHSHVNRDITLEGVRYVNNAFAYPSETRIAAKRLLCVVEDVTKGA